MHLRTKNVRAFEARSAEIGLQEPSLIEYGSVDLCIAEFGPVKPCATQNSAGKIEAGEIEARQLLAREIGPLEGVAAAIRASTSARVISADVISGDVRSMCRIMPWAAAGTADARPNIPNALVQIDARLIVEKSSASAPLMSRRLCAGGGRATSPRVSTRDHVLDHIRATIGPTGLSIPKIISARSDDAIQTRPVVVTMVPDHWTARRRGASLLNAKCVRVSLLLSEGPS